MALGAAGVAGDEAAGAAAGLDHLGVPFAVAAVEDAEASAAVEAHDGEEIVRLLRADGDLRPRPEVPCDKKPDPAARICHRVPP